MALIASWSNSDCKPLQLTTPKDFPMKKPQITVLSLVIAAILALFGALALAKHDTAKSLPPATRGAGEVTVSQREDTVLDPVQQGAAKAVDNSPTAIYGRPVAANPEYETQPEAY
jgi:hypothetical protein